MRTESRELLAVGMFGGSSRLRERIKLLLRRSRTFSPRASSRPVAAAAVILGALLLTATLAPRWIAFAQAAQPAFDVASIKPGDPSVRGFGVGVRGNLFVATNATLRMLIGFAYDLHDHQISGGPAWLSSARFTIEAKPRPQTEAELRLMIQSLLAERFRLASHRESRVEPIYELVVARSGHHLKETEPDPNGRRGIFGEGRGVNGMAAPTAALAGFLSQTLGRNVVDKTGLAGKYDFKLVWTPGPGEGNPDIPPDIPPPADSSGPSIFTAIQEQLGLKLESSKGPVDVLIIDHAEKPDAN